MSTASRQRTGSSVTVAIVLSAQLGWAGTVATQPEYSHPEITVTESGLYLKANEGIQVIPDVSAYCQQCHTATDETTEVSSDEPGTPHAIGSAAASHPVEVPYPTSTGYVRQKQLDSRILLTDGKLTCLSCHSPTESDHHLILPTAGGQLCQACHLL